MQHKNADTSMRCCKQGGALGNGLSLLEGGCLLERDMLALRNELKPLTYHG